MDCSLSYIHAGDGKTHYIESQLQRCPFFLRIAVNEAFTPLSAIHKLSKVPLDTQGCAVFFNFTMLPPGVRHTISRQWRLVVPYCTHACGCADLVWHSVCIYVGDHMYIRVVNLIYIGGPGWKGNLYIVFVWAWSNLNHMGIISAVCEQPTLFDIAHSWGSSCQHYSLAVTFYSCCRLS